MRRQQRGAALLTALLIVTLVATLAAAMVWRQMRAVHLEAADRARAQAHWVLLGALDWARLILREDQRANQSGSSIDHLGEVWAVPLAEARLSTFLAADKQNTATDEGPEAFLSGSIEDAQARYNLANLAGKEVPALEKRTLVRLCQSAGLPADMAEQLALKLNQALQASGDSSDAPLRPQTVAQLAWLGLPADALRALEPWVVILREPSAVNINTAPREVLAALFDNMDLATAERLVQRRRSQPFNSQEDITGTLGRPANDPSVDVKRVGFSSNHFLVTGRLRLDERVIEQRSLVERKGTEVELLWRERVSPPPGTSTHKLSPGAP